MRTDGSFDAQPKLNVRGLHNYAYCPRLFYYQWVENIFQHNADTVEGGYAHRASDRPTCFDELKDAIELPEDSSIRSMHIESDTYGLVGVVDLIETRAGGVTVIDYKKGVAWRDAHGNRVAKEPDAVQVVAYALLLRESGHIPREAFIYYAAEKRRVSVDISEERINACVEKIVEAKSLASRGECPPPLEDDPRCLYCSAYPICLPGESAFWRLAKDGNVAIKRAPRPDNDEGEILVVQTPGATVGRRGGEITVSLNGEIVRKLPSRQLRAVYLYGAVQLTAAAAQTLLELGIDVSFFAPSGRFLGLLRGLPASGVDARRGQYRLFEDARTCLGVAREIIRAKIHNQRVMLMRNGDAPEPLLAQLADLKDRAVKAMGMKELLGVEGMAAALYFEQFNGMLKANEHRLFEFHARNRRPPRDPVNALLSMGYSILCKEVTGICHAVGLDPFLGVMHQPRYGRPALALDLMEEFRPLIADSVAISMINRSEVNRGDFIISAAGVSLDEQGRRAFWESYCRRMETEVAHPHFGYRMPYRRMLEVQVRQMWRFVRGEANNYIGFTTR